MEYLIGALIVATWGGVARMWVEGVKEANRIHDELDGLQRQINEDTARLRDELGIDLGDDPFSR